MLTVLGLILLLISSIISFLLASALSTSTIFTISLFSSNWNPHFWMKSLDVFCLSKSIEGNSWLKACLRMGIVTLSMANLGILIKRWFLGMRNWYARLFSYWSSIYFNGWRYLMMWMRCPLFLTNAKK